MSMAEGRMMPGIQLAGQSCAAVACRCLASTMVVRTASGSAQPLLAGKRVSSA